jgi:putative transposase
MRNSRYTDGPAAFALQQAKAGTGVPEVCRVMGVSEASLLQVEAEVSVT